MAQFDFLKKHIFEKKAFYTLLGIFLLLFMGLDGGRPFATPDEARYVEIPREMIASGDFITPRLNAMKYFEKPPLFYWMQAIVLKIFGMNEGVMRMNVALCAFLTILSLFYFVRRFIEEQVAIYASIVLSTSGLFYALSRLIILDMVLTTFISIAFIAFYTGISEKNRRKRRCWFYAFTIACGLGVLTKGIVVLALVGPAIIIWLTLEKQWGSIFPLFIPSCILLFLLITVPWHYLAAIHNHDFLHKYFYVEHFLRYTTTIHSRYQPVWFFIPIILLAVIPWLTSILQGIIEFKKKDRQFFSYLIIWFSWVFVFYSFGNSKLVPYILPCLPPLAVLGGFGLYHWQKNQQSILFARWGVVFQGIIGFIALFLPVFYKDIFYGCEDIINSVYIIAGIFLLLGIVAFFIKKNTYFICVYMFSALMFITIANVTAPSIQKTSVKPLALWIKENKQPGDAIVSFQNYYQDLPLYTETVPVVCVDDFNELDFGMEAEIEKTKEWMLTGKEFQKKFQPTSGRNFWMIITEKRYPKLKKLTKGWSLKVIGRYKELLLIYHKG